MDVQLVVTAGNRSGEVIPIPIGKFIIGRASDCHLRPMSEVISRYHCAILVGNNVVIRDLGSKNGVWLNGKKIVSEQEINNGDKLVLGPLEFYIRIAVKDSSSGTPHDDPDATWLQPSESIGSLG